MDIKDLIKLGRGQGFLYEYDIRESLPKDITDKDQVEDIFQMIRDLGISIKLTNEKSKN